MTRQLHLVGAVILGFSGGFVRGCLRVRHPLFLGSISNSAKTSHKMYVSLKGMEGYNAKGSQRRLFSFFLIISETS